MLCQKTGVLGDNTGVYQIGPKLSVIVKEPKKFPRIRPAAKLLLVILLIFLIVTDGFYFFQCRRNRIPARRCSAETKLDRLNFKAQSLEDRLKFVDHKMRDLLLDVRKISDFETGNNGKNIPPCMEKREQRTCALPKYRSVPEIITDDSEVPEEMDRNGLTLVKSAVTGEQPKTIRKRVIFQRQTNHP